MNKNKFNAASSSEELRDARLTGWEDAADYAPGQIINISVGGVNYAVRNESADNILTDSMLEGVSPVFTPEITPKMPEPAPEPSPEPVPAPEPELPKFDF